MITRRDVLRAGVAATIVPFIAKPQIACADTADFWVKDRSLWLRRSHIGEEFHVPYWTDGKIINDNYIALCYILRDAYEHTTVTIDVNLLNLLYGIQQWDLLLTHQEKPVMINSGYRTLEHNAHLEGAARNSMHLYGRAADIHIDGRSPDEIARMAGFFGFGGVGLYPTFTHVDTGRQRFWRG